MKLFRISAIALSALFLCTNLYSESIIFSAKSMSHDSAEGREQTVLSGNAYVKTGTKEIKADEIRLLGENYNILLCNGNVTVIDNEDELTISADSLYYDRELKLIRINGRSETEDLKNQLIIKAGYLEYRQKDKILQLQIGVRILKENLTCRSEFATYDKNSDSLEMSGLPVVYKDNDTFKASRITVMLENDEIRMDGQVEGSLKIEEQKKNSGNDPES